MSDPKSSKEPTSERIAKYLASAGVASRREVERMIAEGRVIVNGSKLDTPAFKVTGQETILVDGKPVARPQKTRLWKFHKAVGLVTTNSDPDGRPTIFEVLPKGFPRVVTIGRLDINTEGLLLLTNDGELSRALELPATGIRRTYRARAFGQIEQIHLDKLKDGITYEGVDYRSIIATLIRRTGSNCWIELTLTEGKKREARRALESLGLKVSRLIRTSYGPIELGNLGVGELEEIPTSTVLANFSEHLSDARRPPPRNPNAGLKVGHKPGKGRPASSKRSPSPRRKTGKTQNRKRP